MKRTSNSSQSACPTGQVLWEELLEEAILHIILDVLNYIGFYKTSACVCRTSENCKSLILQDKCNIEIFLSPECPIKSKPMLIWINDIKHLLDFLRF